MTDLLDILVFDGLFLWLLVVITGVAIAGIPRFFGLNYLNALLSCQLMLFFNAITIISGLNSQHVSVALGFHFYIIEFLFLILIYSIYAYFLRYRVKILESFKIFADGDAVRIVTIFLIVNAIFNYYMAPDDGSSRIAYMTQPWFSFVKPFIQILVPLSYFMGLLIILSGKRKFLGYFVLGIVVAANIATGSKASFVMGMVTAFLAVRDLTGSEKLLFKPFDLVAMSILLFSSAIYAFCRLDVAFDDVLNRIFLFGEANILTYFADEPTVACAKVSTFASMHRGWARLIGDESALDIDTLFGFALTIQHLGVNTFTGPNARLSAYFLCNFPGFNVLYGLVVLFFYLFLMLNLFGRIISHAVILVLFYPFLINSINGASQDFNLIMQDITIFVILILGVYFLNAVLRSQKIEQ